LLVLFHNFHPFCPAAGVHEAPVAIFTAISNHGTGLYSPHVIPAKAGIQALKSLRDYVGKRIAMTDYPAFRELGYDCGSGPTESLCGTLTKLEGFRDAMG